MKRRRGTLNSLVIALLGCLCLAQTGGAWDLFVSSTEGGVPVVLQEAASVGLPLVATDVGGVREIVSEANGLLLASNPSVAEIVSGLKTATVEADAQERMQLRSESRKVWENYFSAENNHVAFAKYLRGLYLGKISQNSKE